MFLVFVFSCAFLNSERSIPINLSICSSGVVLITASSRFFSASFLSAVKRVVSKYRPCSDFASCIFSVRGSCSCCGRETSTCWVLLRYPSSFFSVRIVPSPKAFCFPRPVPLMRASGLKAGSSRTWRNRRAYFPKICGASFVSAYSKRRSSSQRPNGLFSDE